MLQKAESKFFKYKLQTIYKFVIEILVANQFGKQMEKQNFKATAATVQQMTVKSGSIATIAGYVAYIVT